MFSDYRSECDLGASLATIHPESPGGSNQTAFCVPTAAGSQNSLWQPVQDIDGNLYLFYFMLMIVGVNLPRKPNSVGLMIGGGNNSLPCC